MASSSVSQEEVEKDFQLLNRRSKIRIARARNAPTHSQRPGITFQKFLPNKLLLKFQLGEEMEAEDREESPKPIGKIKDRRTVRTERLFYFSPVCSKIYLTKKKYGMQAKFCK